MREIKQTLNFIKEGRKGHNKGVRFTVSKINKYIKVWRGRYYLIFALSGVGKSKFVYDQFLFNIVDQQINHNVLDNLHIDLYSLEISPITVTGNLIIQYLEKYKNIITDLNQIFSYDNKINDGLQKHIDSLELQEFLTEAYKYIKIYTYLDFNSLVKNTTTQLEKMGTLYRRNNYIESFKPDVENYLYELIIDHVSLARLIPKHNRYETIGVISKYLFAIRDKVGLTPIIVQQVKPDRTRKPEETVSPAHEDLRDSPETYNDSDIALGIGNPSKHKITMFPDRRGYSILPSPTNPNALQDRFRFIEIRKNRYGGGENKIIPSLFIGETSNYKNIKTPKEMTTQDYLDISNIKKTYKNN